MKFCKCSVLLCLIGLMACQPKGSFTYQHLNAEDFEINQMMVVIDYLNLRDDIGKYWDFDSHYHQKTLNHLLAQINREVQKVGYPQIQSYLLTSGLLIKGDLAVDHYSKEQLQAELLYPPYSLAQQNISDDHISDHQEFLGLMVKYIAARRHLENDELSHRGMQMKYHFDSMDLAGDTAILYIHINQSAVGIIKQLSTVLLSGAVASQADFGYINADFSNKKHASAFLVHKGSGQILWKNHSTQWSTTEPISKLLTSFPRRF